MAEQKPAKSHGLENLRGLEAAIDEQRQALFTATALIDVVATALENIFGTDWPSKYPEFPRVLRVARKLVDDAAGSLECNVLLDRGDILEVANDD